MAKYRVISSPYFPVFSSNTAKYGPEITLYLDTFHVVTGSWSLHGDHVVKNSSKLSLSILAR